MTTSVLKNINTPAYVADIAAIKRNMAMAGRVKREAGVKILLATKAFAMPAVFPFMRDTLDGTTASGLYEAKLGAEHFGKDVHTYSPAFTEDTLRDILNYSGHIYFNSISQLKKFAPLVRQTREDATITLRVNPKLPLVKNSSLYDPSLPTSRYGVEKEEITDEVLGLIDGLHFHNLCENMAEDSAKLIKHIQNEFAFALPHISKINLGGGHYMTHAEYDLDILISTLKGLKNNFDGTVIMEPGGTLVYNGGYLVASVLDIFERQDGTRHAIIDASASTHMPDVLEVPYRPDIIDSFEDGEKAHTYILGGNTCMTGDVIGTYSFDAPLEIGQKLIFTDMMQYSFVKNTTFNGVPLPDLGILHEDVSYELVKSFSYENFSMRLGVKRGD